MRRISGSLVMATLALAVGAGALAAENDTNGWLDAATSLVPQGYVAGQAYRRAGTTMGFLAAFPESANKPATPGSAFDPGYQVSVTLGLISGKPAFLSGTFGKADKAETPASANEAYHADLLKKLLATARDLPLGTMPCQIAGWSASDDPHGLSVHAGPLASSPILGRIAPPFLPAQSEIAPQDGWRAEFNIIGYRDGWFLIDGTQEPGAPYLEAATDGRTPSYAGRGWVRTADVGAAYANTQMPVGWLLQAPNIHAKPFIPTGHSSPNESMSIDGTLKRLLACSANWALTESTDGTRGWWRGTCSNQATNCS
jgi:hypothetical protein